MDLRGSIRGSAKVFCKDLRVQLAVILSWYTLYDYTVGSVMGSMYNTVTANRGSIYYTV